MRSRWLSACQSSPGTPTIGTIAWWVSLPPYPETPAQIVTVPSHMFDENNTPVYVRSTFGNTWKCCDHSGWVKESPIDAFPSDSFPLLPCPFPYDRSNNVIISNLPAPIEQCARGYLTYEFVDSEIYYVLLQDKSLWRWHYYFGIDRTLTYLFLGTMMGGFLGWLLLHLYYRIHNLRFQRS